MRYVYSPALDKFPQCEKLLNTTLCEVFAQLCEFV